MQAGFSGDYALAHCPNGSSLGQDNPSSLAGQWFLDWVTRASPDLDLHLLGVSALYLSASYGDGRRCVPVPSLQ